MNRSEKKLLVVNQNSGYLIIDVLNNLVFSYNEIVLISGNFPASSRELSKEIRFKRTFRYNTKNIYSKLFSWIFCTFHLFILLLFRYRKYKVLYFTNPPMSYFCSLILKNEFSIVVFDLYPNALKLIGITQKNVVYKLWKKINNKIFSRAEKIYVLSDKMNGLLQEYVQKQKIITVELWSSSSDFKPIPKEENKFLIKHNLQEKFLVLYSGNLGLGHNLDVLVNLAKEFRSYADIHFLVIGDGIQKKSMVEKVSQWSLENISFLPFQDSTMLPFSLAAADVSVVTMSPNVTNFSLPSKFFNAIAVGSPILAIGGWDSELEVIVKRFNVGIFLRTEEIFEANKFIVDLFMNSARRLEFVQNALECSEHFSLDNAKIIEA